nr:type VI secretion system baseplate subunit TssF [Escherichia coli]
MFVALNGLEQVAWPEGITGFEIDVVLNENWPHDLPFDSDNIRLHCVPVINLFPLKAGYPLRPCNLLQPVQRHEHKLLAEGEILQQQLVTAEG